VVGDRPSKPTVEIFATMTPLTFYPEFETTQAGTEKSLLHPLYRTTSPGMLFIYPQRTS
jgi:hypothetical protein